MPESRRLSPAARALEAAVLFYQKHVSPFKMVASCRFEPSCSSYALSAVRHHGALKGFVMALARLSKCGPWHPGGYDPVPEETDLKES